MSRNAGAKFEALWPFDVNEPGVERLNRYVNLPAEWETDAGSGLDFMLCEALSFGAVERNLDKARQAIQFFYNLDKVRWMAGYPFEALSWPRPTTATSWAFQCRLALGARLPHPQALPRPAHQDLGLRPPVPFRPRRSLTCQERVLRY